MYATIINKGRYNAPMLHALKLHPESPCSSVAHVDAYVTRQTTRLTLRYVVTGQIASLALPQATAPARSDDLWQHTCCEAFVGIPGSAAYFEFNFSPSTQWAAYRFGAYRERCAIAEIPVPIITVNSAAEQFELQAVVDCAQLAFSASASWRIGVSAVIEESSGRKSYWALAHATAKPDFHHADGFVIQLQDRLEA